MNIPFKSKIKFTKRGKWELALVVALFGITILYSAYVRLAREQNEKTAAGKIYQIETASKGNISLKFYFLTHQGDTIKSSHYLYPKNTKEYYLNNTFLVKYADTSPDNNEIVLDKPINSKN